MVSLPMRCKACSVEMDATEFSDVRDADICGYCFAAKTTEIRNRKYTFASGQNDVGIWREITFMASIEIRMEHAKAYGDSKAVEIYEQILRLIRA